MFLQSGSVVFKLLVPILYRVAVPHYTHRAWITNTQGHIKHMGNTDTTYRTHRTQITLQDTHGYYTVLYIIHPCNTTPLNL